MKSQKSEEQAPRILIVDDDPGLRLQLRAALKKSGFTVAEAENGEQALASFAADRPAAILLDVVMPGMDGFGVCREIRARAGGEHTPVLMMTGLEDIDAIHRAFEAGATDFISKPVNWAMLDYRIRYMLRSSETFEALRKSQERLALAQEIARIGHWEIDRVSGRVQLSGAAAELLGLREAKGGPAAELFSACAVPEDRGRVRQAIGTALAEGVPFELFYRLVAGERETVVCNRAKLVHAEKGGATTLLGTVQDVTELRKAQERVHFLAYYDELTGLGNRALFNDRIEQAIASASRYKRVGGLLYLDLDHFKRINDTLGHRRGDLLLKQVAERLRHYVRKADLVSRPENGDTTGSVSRLGGDEFTVLLAELRQPQDAAQVAQRLLELLAEPFLVDGEEVFLTASIGISIYPHDGEDPETLLKNADTAMSAAKERGRNSYQFYEESMTAHALERMAVETDLRRAVERKEFQLYYQPLVDLAGGRIAGAEALIRWNHPGRGLVSPAEFIPVAEESGLIVPMGNWVLREAAQQNRAWKQAGLPPLRVSVNLSARQFTQDDVVARVREALKESGLPGSDLELEITESLLMDNTDRAAKILRSLKELGVRIAIDDFGTGYSSLSYLKAFPIDTLKIDRSFIKNMIEKPDDAAAIVEAIIAMAKALRLKVVAEGVETREQLSFLQMLGCDQVQGFFFSRPVPAPDFATLLKEGVKV